MLKNKEKYDLHIVRKGNTYRFFKNYYLAYLFMRIASCELMSSCFGKLETSCEDINTRYLTIEDRKHREIYRKGKRGWYYAGWYYI